MKRSSQNGTFLSAHWFTLPETILCRDCFSHIIYLSNWKLELFTSWDLLSLTSAGASTSRITEKTSVVQDHCVRWKPREPEWHAKGENRWSDFWIKPGIRGREQLTLLSGYSHKIKKTSALPGVCMSWSDRVVCSPALCVRATPGWASASDWWSQHMWALGCQGEPCCSSQTLPFI